MAFREDLEAARERVRALEVEVTAARMEKQRNQARIDDLIRRIAKRERSRRGVRPYFFLEMILSVIPTLLCIAVFFWVVAVVLVMLLGH